MTDARIALVSAVALLLGACSAPAATPSPAPTASPPTATAAPATLPPATPAPGTAAPTAAAMRVDVTLSDDLRIEPAEMTVPAGVPVTFVITNEGVLEHEFYLGDEAAQQAHAQEMADMGGMLHDEPEGIGVAPGQTRELTYTFAAPGETLAGCHVQGHYLAGMKAAIHVE